MAGRETECEFSALGEVGHVALSAPVRWRGIGPVTEGRPVYADAPLFRSQRDFRHPPRAILLAQFDQKLCRPSRTRGAEEKDIVSGIRGLRARQHACLPTRGLRDVHRPGISIGQRGVRRDPGRMPGTHLRRLRVHRRPIDERVHRRRLAQTRLQVGPRAVLPSIDQARERRLAHGQQMPAPLHEVFDWPQRSGWKHTGLEQHQQGFYWQRVDLLQRREVRALQDVCALRQAVRVKHGKLRRSRRQQQCRHQYHVHLHSPRAVD